MKRMMRIAGMVLILATGCTRDRIDLPDEVVDGKIYATVEQPDSGTKVYADEEMMVLWNEEDYISFFNLLTLNEKWMFMGDTGDNAGYFEPVSSPVGTGNELAYYCAVYPYMKTTRISNQNVMTLTLPAEQTYAENSFGIGANTMIAVSKSSIFGFKNVCGYLSFKLYGDGVKVASITLKGNSGEPLAGKGTIPLAVGKTPVITMGTAATGEITLVCETPVALGATADDYTEFWMVVPPTVFSGGFTITVTDDQGGVFEKSTTKSFEVKRSNISRMKAFEVIPVIPGQVSTITLNKTELTLPVGKPEVLTAEIYPADAVAENPVTWTSSRPSVATVDETGKVTAVNVGETVITATAGSKSAECKVTVTVADENSPIVFADEKLKERLVAKFDTDGDGEISYAEAAAVTSIEGAVTIKTVTSFDEFQYFTGVKEIPESMFEGWNLLTSVILPESITSIGNYAFKDCVKIESLELPDNIKYLGYGLFSGCKSLKRMVIPESVVKLGRTLNSSSSGSNYYKDGVFNDCTSLEEIILPDNLSVIGLATFRNCSSLTKLNIPESVQYIGQAAFYGCSNLSCEITVPDQSVVPYSFIEGCKKIKTVHLNNTITEISNNSFAGSGITSLDIPESVTSIGGHAFSDCEDLTSVIIPESVSTIEYCTFSGCSRLTSVTIPESVTSIGDAAFGGCSSLTSVTIPESVTSIRNDAFAGCSSLTSVTIPESVTSIGDSAFSGCSSLTSITINAITPPYINYNSFSNTNNCPIYVPAESVDAYKAASGWRSYAGRIQAISQPNSVILYTSSDGSVVKPRETSVCGANIVSNDYADGKGKIVFDGEVTQIGDMRSVVTGVRITTN